MIKKIIEYFIPPGLTDSDKNYRRTRLVAYTLFITALFTLFYCLICLFIAFYLAIFMLLSTFFIYFLLLFWLRNGGNVYKVANWYGTTGALGIYGSIYYSGGFESPVLPWLASTPIVLLLLAGKKSGYAWASISVLVVYIFGYLQYSGFPFPKAYNLDYNVIFAISCHSGLVLIIFVLSLVFENVRLRAFNQVTQEKQRSDDLLLNILPAEVMNELKNTGKTTARNFDQTTVMFVDFKDFTLLSTRQTPEQLVNGIDNYFEAFDRIVARYKIEKIKTIGDAYLCVGGVPVPDTRNALEVLDAAFEFLAAANELKSQRIASNDLGYDIRIGIHSGPLIAGVVGIKKFAYDIWGDAVNTAARMQQLGEEGKINISGTTYELIKHHYICTHRGRIEAKNKGLIDMYFVEGKK